MNERLDVICAGVARCDEDAFGWGTREVLGTLKVPVFGHEDVSVIGGPCPDAPIVRPFQSCLGDMRGAGKLIGQAMQERAREVLIEKQPQAVAVRLRICSAA